ncbi:putative autotransporter [Acetobacter pasteurianus subsp. pasteurianus]|uniref:Putative autotransporter n=1 Tax=Acetobacter pasteurianus subsp. pasteurianus TaxID=481145 RepID=A0A1Y0Y588_ACEPA|nr:putative autotransporter [Acetobacter pasteurianus subsp. pasteurianus]
MTTGVTSGVLSIDAYVGGASTIPSGPGNSYDKQTFSSVIIQSGGTWTGPNTIGSGGTVTVSQGGVLSGGAVLNGGSIVSYNSTSGGLTFAWGSGGGTLELKSGALDRAETPLAGNASIIVDAGATLSGITLLSGNSLVVSSGGTLNGTTTINAGATATFSAGAKETGVTLNGGTINAYNSPPYFKWGTSGGTLVLENGVTDINESPKAGSATIIVQSGATISSATLLSGNKLAIYSGGVATSTIVSSGGGVAVYGSASNTTVNGGGVIEITSSGTATGGTINGGSAYVDASGTLNSATVANNGVAVVSAGASANTITVETNASLAIQSGGIASGTIVNSNGGLAVSGSAANTIVNNSGVVEINSGGTATGTTVNSGGVVYADASSILGTTTVSNGGQISAASGATISGTVTIEDGGSATIWNNAGGSVDLQGDTNTGLVISGLASGGTLNTVISGFNGASASNSDSIELAGVKATDVASVTYPSADQVQLTLSNNNSITLNIVGVKNYGFTLADGSDGWLSYEVCFLSGSMIRTPEGDVAVENLQIGDQVVAFDWKNNKEISHPVLWVGKTHATVRAGLPDDDAGYPVRILKDAIADGVPYKDMLITPEHCLFFEGKFVPARMLVNGISIFYDKSITSYDYYHVETEQHSVIRADGMLTESYMDTGNRRSFRQEGSVVMLGGKIGTWEEDAAAPLCVDRAFVEPLFRKLEYRGNNVIGHEVLALPLEQTNDANLHLLTQTGAVIRPMRHNGQQYSFMLPAGTQSVRIVSRASRPADVIGPFVDDRRHMGVAIADIHLLSAKQQHNITTHLQAEKPEGWHATDWTDCAWTNGNAQLPLDEQLLNGKMGILSLTIRAAGPYLIDDQTAAETKVLSA